MPRRQIVQTSLKRLLCAPDVKACNCSNLPHSLFTTTDTTITRTWPQYLLGELALVLQPSWYASLFAELLDCIANNKSAGSRKHDRMAAISRWRRRFGPGLLQGRIRAAHEQEGGCVDSVPPVSRRRTHSDNHTNGTGASKITTLSTDWNTARDPPPKRRSARPTEHSCYSTTRIEAVARILQQRSTRRKSCWRRHRELGRE